MDSILAIVGATASGKTERGLHEAQRIGGEIISADSRQLYRRLNVGTAKPKGEWVDEKAGVPRYYEVNGIPYHLVDIIDPTMHYTAAQFSEEASKLIHSIRERHKVPILVGGTGFYLKALNGGLAPLPPADETLRATLRLFSDQEGRPALHAQLASVDPEAAARIPANNIHRVIRAIEVFRLTGKPMSVWHREHQAHSEPAKFSFNYQGTSLEPSELEARIAQRCRAMVEGGMIEETEQLLSEGIPATSPALTSLGYPHVVNYLGGGISKDALIAHLTLDTRRYAKRQLTWFRHQAKVTWKK